MMLGKLTVVAALAMIVLAGCGDESLPAAADGTNLKACSDGSCEVLVDSDSVVDVPDLGPIEIAIKDDTLEVASRSDDGQGNTSELSASGTAGQKLVLNELEFTVVAVLGQQGVLRVGA